jgi:hypothetical protein
MADQQDRLRDAFAQLLAQGQDKAVPMEAVMAAQGRQQLPPPRPDPNLDRPQIYNDETVGTPTLRAPGPPDTHEFPTAQANPKISSEKPPAPFPGAKSVEVKPYKKKGKT